MVEMMDGVRLGGGGGEKGRWMEWKYEEVMRTEGEEEWRSERGMRLSGNACGCFQCRRCNVIYKFDHSS
jgi:hypothetical protein